MARRRVKRPNDRRIARLKRRAPFATARDAAERVDRFVLMISSPPTSEPQFHLSLSAADIARFLRPRGYRLRSSAEPTKNPNE